MVNSSPRTVRPARHLSSSSFASAGVSRGRREILSAGFATTASSKVWKLCAIRRIVAASKRSVLYSKVAYSSSRSEERRVGKEWRCGRGGGPQRGESRHEGL